MIIGTTVDSVAWQDPDDQSIWYFEHIVGEVDVYHLTDPTQYQVNTPGNIHLFFVPLHPPRITVAIDLDDRQSWSETKQRWTLISRDPMTFLTTAMLE